MFGGWPTGIVSPNMVRRRCSASAAAAMRFATLVICLLRVVTQVIRCDLDGLSIDTVAQDGAGCLLPPCRYPRAGLVRAWCDGNLLGIIVGPRWPHELGAAGPGQILRPRNDARPWRIRCAAATARPHNR